MHPIIDCLRMELGPKSNLSLTTVNVGAVSTEIMVGAMVNPTAEAEAAMTPVKCARLCLEAMIARRREVFLPLVDHPFPIPGQFSHYFPELMELLVSWQYSFTDEKQSFLKDAGGKPPKE